MKTTILTLTILALGSVAHADLRPDVPGVPATYAAGTISAAQLDVWVRSSVAEQRVEAHIAEIQKMLSSLEELYSYDKSAATMEKALKAGGVTTSLRHLDAWPGWMWSWWNEIRTGFYQTHLAALDSSLRTIRDNKGAYLSELERIDARMQDLRPQDSLVRKLMVKYLDLTVLVGQQYDELEVERNAYFTARAEIEKMESGPEKDAAAAAADARYQRANDTDKAQRAEAEAVQKGLTQQRDAINALKLFDKSSEKDGKPLPL